MRKARQIALSALAAIALPCNAAAAAERDAAPSGVNSSGGEAFRDRCPPGEALIGLLAVIDVYEMTAVGGTCARPVSDSMVSSSSIHDLPIVHGEIEGRRRPLRCASPTPVVRILDLDMRASTLRLRCFQARKGPLFAEAPSVGASWGGAGDGMPHHLPGPSSCSEEEMAVGYHGRANRLEVFQLGLICDTAPGHNLPVSREADGVTEGPRSTGSGAGRGDRIIPRDTRRRGPRQ